MSTTSPSRASITGPDAKNSAQSRIPRPSLPRRSVISQPTIVSQPTNLSEPDIPPRPSQTSINTRQSTTINSKNQGKHIVNVPVSKAILQEALYTTEGEFTHLTYTAITSTPQKFIEDSYSVRASQIGRKIKIALVLTMYNEDPGKETSRCSLITRF